ncbi:hypothetical protein LTR94_021323, partial [Friedmanniomyces endolithicus]
MTASSDAAPSRLPREGHGFSQNSPEGAFGASIDPADVARFSAQAAEWWDAHGPFAPLHRFNPARLKLIREQLCARLGRDSRARRPFEGLALLDVGCGGGLIAEPMRRMGFTVTAIDASTENIGTARAHAEMVG